MKTSTSDRLPPSPTRSPDAGFVWWQSLLFTLLLFAAVTIPSTFVAVGMIIGGWAKVRDFQSLTWQVVVSQIVAYAFALAVLGPLLPLLARRSWFALGLRAPRPRDLVYGIVGAALMVVAVLAAASLQNALFHVKPDEVQVQWLRAARGPLVLFFVVLACFGAPLFEEITFRGFVFNALRRYVPVWLAVILSAIVFGLSHWQPGNAGAILPLAVGGAVLALVYYRARSLVASMLTHALFNGFTVVLVVVFHQT